MGLVETYPLPHEDMGISGPMFGSPERRAHICVKYSEIPELLYVLAGAVGISSLTESQLKEARECDFISFADEDYRSLKERVDGWGVHYRKVWKMLDDEEMRKNATMVAYHTPLIRLKETLPAGWDYLGMVRPTAEYSLIHVLYNSDSILAYQAGRGVMIGYDDAKEAIRFSVDRQGACVSPALRPYVEQKS